MPSGSEVSRQLPTTNNSRTPNKNDVPIYIKNKQEIETNNQQFQDAKREIETNNQQLQDAKREIETNNKQLQDGKKEIAALQNENSALKAELQIQSNVTTLLSGMYDHC